MNILDRLLAWDLAELLAENEGVTPETIDEAEQSFTIEAAEEGAANANPGLSTTTG